MYGPPGGGGPTTNLEPASHKSLGGPTHPTPQGPTFKKLLMLHHDVGKGERDPVTWV